MKNTNNSLYISFISLLILNMILIFFGLYSYFFDVKDYTIIAGIIGFVGAIIGGTITLVGVNKTIESNNLNKKLDNAPKQLESIAYNIKFLMKLWEQFQLMGIDRFQKPNETYNNATKLISDSNFIELSASISPKVYKKTTDLQYLLMERNLRFNQQIEPYDYLKYYNDCQEIILDLVQIYKEEEKGLLEIISEYR